MSHMYTDGKGARDVLGSINHTTCLLDRRHVIRLPEKSGSTARSCYCWHCCQLHWLWLGGRIRASAVTETKRGRFLFVRTELTALETTEAPTTAERENVRELKKRLCSFS